LIYDTSYLFMPHYYGYQGWAAPTVNRVNDDNSIDMVFSYPGGESIQLLAYQKLDNVQQTADGLALNFNNEDHFVKIQTQKFGEVTTNRTIAKVANNTLVASIDMKPVEDAKSAKAVGDFFVNALIFLLIVAVVVALSVAGWAAIKNIREQRAEQARRAERAARAQATSEAKSKKW
jgi:hypothetical protein